MLELKCKNVNSVDNMGIDDAISFIKKINDAEGTHIADKTASFSRYSRIGLTITPAYLKSRGNNQAKRRRVHPLGIIQYIAASLLIAGISFTEEGAFFECAKAKEEDVFFGSLCLYIKELDNLRAVLPMDDRDTLNLTKVFDETTLKEFPQFTMATPIPLFEKLQATYVEKYIRPAYGSDTKAYTAFWEMMYYRTFVRCFNRYMPELLQLAKG
jgi:hypothetical protein